MTSENRYVLYFQVKGTCPYLSNNHSTMMNLLIFQDEVDDMAKKSIEWSALAASSVFP